MENFNLLLNKDNDLDESLTIELDYWAEQENCKIEDYEDEDM